MNWGNLIQPTTGPNDYRYDLEMKKERGGKRLIKNMYESQSVVPGPAASTTARSC